MIRLLVFPSLLLATLLVWSPSEDAIAEKKSVAVVSMETEAAMTSLYYSKDEGKNWRPAPHDLPEGTNVTDIQWFGNRMLVATDNNGLQMSNAGMTEWKQLSSHKLGGKINALATDGGLIYASPYKKGIYVSMDKGFTFHPLNYDLTDLRVQAIHLMDDRILIGTDDGLFYLAAGTRQWKPVFQGPQITSISGIGETLIAGTNFGLLESVDKGESWKAINQDGAVHWTTAENGHFFATYIGGKVQVSPDRGLSWVRASYGPKERSYVYDAIGLSNGQFIMSNEHGVHRSLPGGLYWTLIAPLQNEKVFFSFARRNGIIYGGTRPKNGC